MENDADSGPNRPSSEAALSIAAYAPAGPVRLARALALAVLLTLVGTLPTGLVGPAGAAVGDPGQVQCFSGTSQPGCTPLGLPFQALDMALSPDGRHLYSVSVDGSLVLFDRGPGNRLTPRPGSTGCYNANGIGPCTYAPGLIGAVGFDITVSPDGRSVYVAASNNLVSFRRDLTTGVLTPGPCYGSGAGCTAVDRLFSITGVVVSHDNQNVYTRGQSTILVFDRDTSTGALTRLPGTAGCLAEVVVGFVCADVVGLGNLNNGYGLVLSPDDRYLYGPSQSPGGISFFVRDLGDGTLSQTPGLDGGCLTAGGISSSSVECIALPAGAAAAAGGTGNVGISPSGRYVFTTGSAGTVVYARDAGSGKLAVTDCVAKAPTVGCQLARGAGGRSLSVTPDGSRVAVGANDIGGAGMFAFDDINGHLTQLPDPVGCFAGLTAPGCTSIPGGNALGFGAALFAPDGQSTYVVNYGPLVVLENDQAPACTPVSATTVAGKTATVQLSCADPNGDAVSVVVGAPGHGQVGVVDQATQRVTYTVDQTYAGADSFTYVATAKGVSSPPATVSLTVLDGLASVKIVTTRVKVDESGTTKVKLSCPATESHGPCTGVLKVRTRDKVDVGIRNKVVVLAKTKYKIPTGSTKTVVGTLGKTNLKLVGHDPSARKLLLVAKVKDTLGNRAVVQRQATLKLT